MTRLTFCSALLIAALCSLGCDRRASSPGAHPQEIDSDYLLPDGKRWQYDLVLPNDISTDDLLRLEIRRFLIEEVDEGIRSPGLLPAAQAEEVWSGPAFRLDSSEDGVRVSLQLLDLRDYSTSPLPENAIKLVGGLNVSGQIAQVRCEPNFVIGENAGISPSPRTSWHENELRLLRFWTATTENEFIYDVCVRVVKSD